MNILNFDLDQISRPIFNLAPVPALPQDREVGADIGEEASQGGQGRGHREGEEEGGTQAHQEADRDPRGGGARDLGQGI